METLKIETSLNVLNQYRVSFRILKKERIPETEPPPLRSLLESFLKLFSTRASHVLDREVGLWHPPERRELWLGKWESKRLSDSIR